MQIRDRILGSITVWLTAFLSPFLTFVLVYGSERVSVTAADCVAHGTPHASASRLIGSVVLLLVLAIAPGLVALVARRTEVRGMDLAFPLATALMLSLVAVFFGLLAAWASLGCQS